jgi:branched-chain amino acid transport system ATP-binding protein
MSEYILKCENVNAHYGAIHAIKNINLEIKKGEIVTLIGANGAGKTTTLHTISGLMNTSSGKIIFKNDEIQNLPAHQIVQKGLAQSPEGRLVFANMSIKENLEMGAYLRSDKKKINDDLDFMISLFPKIKDRYNQLAGTLSGGEQQMLAIARSYMSAPELLLLDEPSLGIAPILVHSIFKAIVEIRDKGMSILLVEQNANLALKISDRGYVLSNGKVSLTGKSSELLSNEEVRKAYLGH